MTSRSSGSSTPSTCAAGGALAAALPGRRVASGGEIRGPDGRGQARGPPSRPLSRHAGLADRARRVVLRTRRKGRRDEATLKEHRTRRGGRPPPALGGDRADPARRHRPTLGHDGPGRRRLMRWWGLARCTRFSRCAPEDGHSRCASAARTWPSLALDETTIVGDTGARPRAPEAGRGRGRSTAGPTRSGPSSPICGSLRPRGPPPSPSTRRACSPSASPSRGPPTSAAPRSPPTRRWASSPSPCSAATSAPSSPGSRDQTGREHRGAARHAGSPPAGLRAAIDLFVGVPAGAREHGPYRARMAWRRCCSARSATSTCSSSTWTTWGEWRIAWAAGRGRRSDPLVHLRDLLVARREQAREHLSPARVESLRRSSPRRDADAVVGPSRRKCGGQDPRVVSVPDLVAPRHRSVVKGARRAKRYRGGRGLPPPAHPVQTPPLLPLSSRPTSTWPAERFVSAWPSSKMPSA